MSLVSCDPEEVEAMRKIAPEGPVVMTNLVKFKADDGRERYAEYVRAAATAAGGSGAEILYVGAAGPDFAAGSDWDLVALVKYPSFDAFADVMTHPAYLKDAIPLREAALERAVLMMTTPAGLA